MRPVLRKRQLCRTAIPTIVSSLPQLERAGEQAYGVSKVGKHTNPLSSLQLSKVAPDAFANLAGRGYPAAWNAPNVSMRARQQLLRTLITDIVS